MGVISRKIFPACESMCICCPALRSRSRQPVKRYKKLLADIFPKSTDVSSSDRKIVKLCEYAAKNPFRIPKIMKSLEERCFKELRSEHVKFLNIIMDIYNKLLCICKDQMAYFAVSLLGVVKELLDNCQQDAVQILGCQTLTNFISSQSDTTYTHSIEKYVRKVCVLARESGEGDQRRRLRASTLQCLSAMVWFMAKFSYIFVGFDEIVHVTLDNYELDSDADHDEGRGMTHHNWVDEVVRAEGRVGGDGSPNCLINRHLPDKKDPSLLTREESETPKVWAQICLQRMADLAKESTTTMRHVLEPMLMYFDLGRHWSRQKGLAFVVLSDMTFMVENSVNQQSLLAAVVRHLDHKNVSLDPQLKSFVVKVATALVRQIRLENTLAEIGFVLDLCWHLRKSLQARVESAGEHEQNLNASLQNAIEDCLLEIAKGIGDAHPLLDMMTITLEKLPSGGIVAKATIGSSMILAHMISLISHASPNQPEFPEELLVQILRAMLHSDPEVRVGAHQLFSVLLIPSSGRPRHEISTLRASGLYEPRRWQSSTASALASVTVRLEKLRKERNGMNVPEKHVVNTQDDFKGIESPSEDWTSGCAFKNSPNFCKISEAGPYVLKFSEDQISQLLSAFWLQANLLDNLPSNYEAIAHSYVLTLLSSRLMNPSSSLVIRIFQLPVALKNSCLDHMMGTIPTSRCRSVILLALSMLMFAAKIYHFFNVVELLKSLNLQDVDPYMGISEDLQLYVRPQADVREFGSATDDQIASLLLNRLRKKFDESVEVIQGTLVQNLSSITEIEEAEVRKQLTESFTSDDVFMFAPQLVHDSGLKRYNSHSQKSLSFDEESLSSSSVDDDATSKASVDFFQSVPRMASPSTSHVISIGQLLESALTVAGQVAGTCHSSSPLPYDTMASQCEALGSGSRKKLSNWLAQENHSTGDAIVPSKMMRELFPIQEYAVQQDSSLAMKLPPASPFDNFLKAAGC